MDLFAIRHGKIEWSLSGRQSDRTDTLGEKRPPPRRAAWASVADGSTATIGTRLHAWQPTGHEKTPPTKERMMRTAKAMMATGIDAITEPTPVARAAASLPECSRDSRGACSDPADAQPPIRPRW